jgi:hypothetical protein
MVKRYFVSKRDSDAHEHPQGYFVSFEDYAALESDGHITAQALNSAMDMVRNQDAKLAELETELKVERERRLKQVNALQDLFVLHGRKDHETLIAQEQALKS